VGKSKSYSLCTFSIKSIIGSFASIEEAVLHRSIIGSDASIKGLSQSLNIGDNTEIDFS
jgi:glucose-1-phosphate thymidylyltransferase